MIKKEANEAVLNQLPVCVFRGLPRFEEEDYKKIHITKEIVKQALPDAKDKDAEIIAQEINRVAKKFHLDTELRLSHLFGQIYHESARGAKTTEDLAYYRPSKLRVILKSKPYYLLHPDKLDSDIKGFYRLPKEERRKAIGSKMYWHKGEPGPNIQHDYSGKGYIQLTNRSNYIDFNKWFHKHYNENINFVEEPEKVATGKYRIISTIYFWDKNKLYILADKNDANGISTIINKRDTGTFKTRKSYVDENLNLGRFSEDKIKSFDADLYQKNLQYILKRPDCAFSLPSPINTNFYSGFIDAEQDSSPLIIDLDGDGVKSIALNHSSVFFDLDNDGFAEKIAWVGPHDGLLVRDLNHNGIIDNGSELFGNHTFCADGQLAHNGFEALQSYQDGGGLLTASSSPKLWKELLIWQDRNSNGRTDQGELTPLSATGIKSINLNYRLSSWRDRAGNSHRQ